jgi:hypothetical protein
MVILQLPFVEESGSPHGSVSDDRGRHNDWDLGERIDCVGVIGQRMSVKVS